MLTLSGGKITDYRKMAEGALRLIRQLLGKEYRNRDERNRALKNIRFQVGNFDPTKLEETVRELAKKKE